MNKDEELLRNTLKIAKGIEEHGYSKVAEECSAIQQQHFDRVNEDCRKTRQAIKDRIAEGEPWQKEASMKKRS